MIQGGRGVTALAAVFLWRQAICDNFVANGYMLNDDGKQALNIERNNKVWLLQKLQNLWR